MATDKINPPSVTPPTVESCRKKKSEDATFMQDVKDHIDEFIHASMDEHKTCFQKTISKMFGMYKIPPKRNVSEISEDEMVSALALHTIFSE